MKKLLSYAACMLIVLSVAAAPDSRLIKSFNETFPNAKNVEWHENKSGYFVYFTQNGNSERVMFNKKGKFVCSWKYGDGKILPTNIAIAINEKYKAGNLLGVIEFTEGENVVYEIKVSKGATWYCVKALPDGTLVDEEKYKSATD